LLKIILKILGLDKSQYFIVITETVTTALNSINNMVS
jgi:hypothetical protein